MRPASRYSTFCWYTNGRRAELRKSLVSTPCQKSATRSGNCALVVAMCAYHAPFTRVWLVTSVGHGQRRRLLVHHLVDEVVVGHRRRRLELGLGVAEAGAAEQVGGHGALVAERARPAPGADRAAAGDELISANPYARAAAPSTLPAAAPMAWRRLSRMSGTFIAAKSASPSLEEVERTRCRDASQRALQRLVTRGRDTGRARLAARAAVSQEGHACRRVNRGRRRRRSSRPSTRGFAADPGSRGGSQRLVRLRSQRRGRRDVPHRPRRTARGRPVRARRRATDITLTMTAADFVAMTARPARRDAWRSSRAGSASSATSAWPSTSEPCSLTTRPAPAG